MTGPDDSARSRPGTDRGRGQTEVLGYILVFSLVVLTVLLVTVSGQAGLANLQDNQRTANVEAGFTVLSDNVDDVVRGGVPSRATEIDLSGERLSLGAPVTVEVTATDPGPDGEVLNQSRSIRPIVYRAPDRAELVYANGAVIARGETGGVVMLREPRALLSSDWTVLPIVDTRFDRRQLRGGSEVADRQSRVLVRTERRQRRVLYSADGPVTVTLNVTSPRAAAWERYLDSAIDPGNDDCSLADDTVSCTYQTEQVRVVIVRIAVSFE